MCKTRHNCAAAAPKVISGACLRCTPLPHGNFPEADITSWIMDVPPWQAVPPWGIGPKQDVCQGGATK